MNLWIRSQDKYVLCKVENIKYIDMSDELHTCNHSIWNDSNGILGIYATKERALEVLEEIQKLDIENNSNIEVTCYAYNLIKVTYIMPKE